MKKRVLSLLLVLCSLLTLVVVPVSGTEATEAQTVEETATDTTALSGACPCGCGETLEQVDWKVYDPNAGGLLPGHFYLAEDYVQKDQFTVATDAKLVLDLRGHTLTTKGYDRLYLIYGYVAVLDSVGGGRMSSKTSGTGNGGVMLLSYSASDSGEKPVFELYSGTITADADNKGGLRGGLVSLGSQSTFRMYGGMVMNGSSQGTTKTASGGCFALASASALLDVRGGKIVGGTSPEYGGNIYGSSGATVSLKNCSVIGGSAVNNGGNIYMTGGTLTIENSIISDGSSEGSYGGGNICAVSGTEVTIRDSVIRNGYGAKQSGNIYFGSGNQLLENTTITAGVCGTYGGNLRVTSNSVTTLDSCTISGDVQVSGSLTLRGATKIGLHNNGLNLILDGTTKAVNAAGLTEGAEIYVNAGALFTDSGAKAEYFKPAMRTAITQTTDGLAGTQVADGEVGGYCPHCGEQTAWTPFVSVSNPVPTGHYYLVSGNTPTSLIKIGGYSNSTVTMQSDVVLDLNGCTSTSSARFAYIYNTSSLTLLDSIGGGGVKGKGTADLGGGVIYNQAGTLNVLGGRLTYVAGKTVTSGGVISGSGTLNVSGGILDGTAYSNTANNGSVIYQGEKTKLNITAGYFMGGTAKNGAALYLSANTQVNITGGQFHGGTAVSGGCLYAAGSSSKRSGTLNISGASFVGGHGTTSGGNLYITYFRNVLVKDCYIAKGTTDDYGGNIVLSTTPDGIRYENCLILGGSAKRGGNIYSASQTAQIQIVNCHILEGTATTYGGNLSMNHGTATVSGCTLAWGKAGTHGGNVYASAGYTIDAPDNRIIFTDGTKLLGGTATEYGGNVYIYGAAELQDAFVNGGKAGAGQDLYLTAGTDLTKLILSEKATGNVQMAVHADRLGQGIYSQPIEGTTAEALSMAITLEGDYGQPRLCAKNGALTVASAIVGDTWYATVEEAAENCTSGELVTLHVSGSMVLSGDCIVDLNGHSLTVTGSGTLYGMDSSGKGGVLPSGKAILSENIQVAEYTRSGDRIYVSHVQNGEATFHHLDMAITGASIRPSAGGIYYTGTWNYDPVLAQKLDTCGVVVSLTAPPTDDFMTEGTSLWTEASAADMTSGSRKNGVLISGILKEDRTAGENDIYGKTSIFAAPYAVLKSGTTLTEGETNYSIYSILKQLEAWTDTDPNTYSCLLLPARNFYKNWKDMGMGSWELSKIPGKANDGKLDILFIGNSFTWYGKCVLDKGQTAWTLDRRVNDQGYFKQICKANGVEASVTNFTFGGHQLSDWYSHKCAANRGHNGLDHLSFLTDRDYDYVVLQQGSAGADTADILAECQPLMDLFREVNPDTKFAFLVHHRVHQTDTSYRSRIKDLEAAGVLVVDWGKLVADVIDGTTQVPGATQTYDNNSFVIRKSESDGYHENMLGGYITAQMLYCAITGESAVGQDYSFCGDTSVNSAFNFEKFLRDEYCYGSATSNFIEIFNSESDMLGLQMLMDQYLAEKTYLNY